jgi:hypothetical protein
MIIVKRSESENKNCKYNSLVINKNMLVEQEIVILPEHLSSSSVFSGVRVTRSLVLCVCFAETNPEEFLPVKPYLYDITFLPVSRCEKSFKKVQGEIAFQYTTEGVASVRFTSHDGPLKKTDGTRVYNI